MSITLTNKYNEILISKPCSLTDAILFYNFWLCLDLKFSGDLCPKKSNEGMYLNCEHTQVGQQLGEAEDHSSEQATCITSQFELNFHLGLA